MEFAIYFQLRVKKKSAQGENQMRN